MHKTIEKLTYAALEDGGATVHLNERRGRYIVGGVRSHWVHAMHALQTSSIDNAARQLRGATGDTIGSWYDKESGLVWFDFGTVHDDYVDAMATARARGEIAIWDSLESIEIRRPVNQAEANSILDATRL